MAEVEIHTGHEASADAFGQRVGIAVGVIGVLLSVVTILGHREHNAAVVRKTEANDQWAYYQAKKIREHNAQIGVTLLTALAADPAKVASVGAKLTADSERYAQGGRGHQGAGAAAGPAVAAFRAARVAAGCRRGLPRAGTGDVVRCIFCHASACSCSWAPSVRWPARSSAPSAG